MKYDKIFSYFQISKKNIKSKYTDNIFLVSVHAKESHENTF